MIQLKQQNPIRLRCPFTVFDADDGSEPILGGIVVSSGRSSRPIDDFVDLTAMGDFELQWELDSATASYLLSTDPDLVLLDLEDGSFLSSEISELLGDDYKLKGTVIACWIENDSIDAIESCRSNADFIFQGRPTLEQIHQVTVVARRWKQAAKKWRQAAERDALTGLIRQAELFRWMGTWWHSESSKLVSAASCVMLDVDFFKRINDCWGHAAGDLVLKTLGDLLREHTPPGAIASRYGGEEFCIVLPGQCEESARQWAEQFRETIAATEIQFEQVTLRMTASLGVAEKLGDVQHPAQLINLADRSLLLAKRSGRNRVVCNSSQSSLNRKPEDSTKKSDFDLNSASARQVMIPVIGGLKSDATSQDAAEYFLRLRISFAPVVDEGLSVVGLLSERDLLSTMLSNEWSKLYVKDVMSPNVVCFEEDTRLAEIMDFICRASCSAVVITRHGSVVGMVTLSSLLRWINNLADTQRDTIHPKNSPEISHRKENVFHQAAKISSALSHEAERLEAYLHQRDENWLPALIAGASRLQELVSDLLACAHQPTNSSSSCNQTQQGLAGLLALTGGLTATLEDTVIDIPAPEHSI